MPTAAKKRSRKRVCTAVATFKGGDGKSTVSVALASLFSAEGFRTLLLELEQRAHDAFAVLPEQPEGDLAHGAKHFLLNEPYTTLPAGENFDILPGSAELDDARVRRLESEALYDRIGGLDYDRIFVDCPANDQILLRNGVIAADTLLVPVMTHPWSRNAAVDTITWVTERAAKGRPAPSRIALIANRLDPRKAADTQFPNHLRETFPELTVFPLRVDVGLLNMVLERRPLRPADIDDVVLVQLQAIMKWLNLE